MCVGCDREVAGAVQPAHQRAAGRDERGHGQCRGDPPRDTGLPQQVRTNAALAL